MTLPYYRIDAPKKASSLVKKEMDPDLGRSIGTLLAGDGEARTLELGQLIGKIGPGEVGAGKLVAWSPTATDGSEIIHGVSLNYYSASDGQDLVDGVLVLRRAAILYAPAIVWPEGILPAEKAAALADMEDRLWLVPRI